MIAPNWGFDLTDDVYKLDGVNGSQSKWLEIFPGPINRTGPDSYYFFAHGSNDKPEGVFRSNRVFEDPLQTKRMLGLPGILMFRERAMKPFEWWYEPVKVNMKTTVSGVEISKIAYLATGPNMYIGDHTGRGIGMFGHSTPLGFLSQRLPKLAAAGELQGGTVLLVDRVTGWLVASSNASGFDTMTFLDMRGDNWIPWRATETTNEIVNRVSQHVAPDNDWTGIEDGMKSAIVLDGNLVYVLTFSFQHHGVDFVGVFAVNEKMFFDDLDSSIMLSQGISIAVNVLVSAAVLGYLVRIGLRQYSNLSKLRAEREQRLTARVRCACQQATVLFFPMYLISLADFETLGKLASHEEAFEEHLLVALSTFEQALLFFEADAERRAVFFSHQWLGWGAVDPEAQHYPAMVKAARQIADRESIPKHKFFIWVDCISIPQSCKYTQSLAIASLTLYCSLCSFFCVVAVMTKHTNSGLTCDFESYANRGWCRLEQFARMVTHGGTQNMFKWTDGDIVEYEFSWDELQAGLRVQEGEFTCCQRGHLDGDQCDKHKCIDTQIGLYNMLWQNAKESGKKSQIFEVISANKASVFPALYFGSLIAKTEETEWCVEANQQLYQQTNMESAKSEEKLTQRMRTLDFGNARTSDLVSRL